MAIQMNVSGIRRNLKNIAHNYTDAQVKVREATSNDPWGPSSTLMSEIADLTYNVVAFSEIMQMIWKRLNDHGRNWRHVYKALVLLEYLIKTGSEKIADQCKENIFAIQTLKDFQYLEENKDMGINVREKAKALVALLKDDERLRNERVRALKAKERFAQSVSGIGSDSDLNSPTSPSYTDTYVTSSSRPTREPFGVPDLESARPQTVGEEELQLQLALAMSKEEADQEEAKRKSDDVRLQMALSQSEVDYNKDATQDKDKSALRDLLDINFNPNGIAASSSMSAIQSQNNTLDPWGVPVGSSMAAGATSSGSVSPQNVSTSAVQPKTSLIDIFQGNDDLNISSSTSANNLHCLDVLNDPWSSPASAPSSRVTSPPTTNDPWAPKPKSPEPPVLDDPWAPKPINDPWNPINAADSEASHQTEVDPFAPIVSENVDEFSLISSRDKNSTNSDDDAFRMDDLRQTLPAQNGLSKSRSPTTFLGENSNLVNLDNLVSVRSNPAGMGGTSSPSYQNMNSLNNNNNNNNNSHLNGFSFASDLEYRTATPEITFNYNNNNNNSSNNNNPFLTQSTISPAALAPSLVPGGNPFNNAPSPPNPFQAQQIPKPSLNEMRTQVIPTPVVSNTPWGPAHATPTTLNRENTSPFML